MKILYITNHLSIAQASGGFISDYQNDLVYYCLRELFGDDVVDSTQIISLYKENEGKIKFKHVNSHTGKQDFESLSNEIADKLANEGAMKTII